jgi:hypothetical protein
MDPLTIETFPPTTVEDMLRFTGERMQLACDFLGHVEQTIERLGIDPATDPVDLVGEHPVEADALCSAQIDFDDAIALHMEWNA